MPDQMHRMVQVSENPQRIISLVPSQTELLYDLGLGNRVVGITKFCVHPEEWFRTKPRVGGTKKVDIEKVRALKPDLIIGNKEENTRADIAALEQEFPVWVSDMEDLVGALEMVHLVGKLTGTPARAAEIAAGIQAAFAALTPLSPPRTAAYFIWKEPLMLAGHGTFIADMLKRCGLNLPTELGDRYPEVGTPELHALAPDVALLSSEPYPFSEKHMQEFADILPGVPVHLVDGEMFSWYGSRLLQAPAYFSRLLERLA
ncbi:MAG TPA: helical backbone metal receptor [Flavobacteriales bacterium]|nr:helical backbone metal receptor [Flavobacteriales bacterium]